MHFDTKTAVNPKTKLIEQETHNFNTIDIRKRHPNVKIEMNQKLNQSIISCLENPRNIIQKDGNIKLRGYLIKGAPSLGTKFNP